MANPNWHADTSQYEYKHSQTKIGKYQRPNLTQHSRIIRTSEQVPGGITLNLKFAAYFVVAMRPKSDPYLRAFSNKQRADGT